MNSPKIRFMTAAIAFSLFANLSAPAMAFANSCDELKADAKELKAQRTKLNKANKDVEAALEALASAKFNKGLGKWIGIPAGIVAGAVTGMSTIGIMQNSPSGVSAGDKKFILGAVAVTVGTVLIVRYTYTQAAKFERLLLEAKANQEEVAGTYDDQRTFLVANWTKNSCEGSPF